MVQLERDEEMGPLHGMYGTLDAELEVQCTIRRAELTAFLCLFGRIGEKKRSALAHHRRMPNCGC